jgi:hypothetical protein
MTLDEIHAMAYEGLVDFLFDHLEEDIVNLIGDAIDTGDMMCVGALFDSAIEGLGGEEREEAVFQKGVALTFAQINLVTMATTTPAEA